MYRKRQPVKNLFKYLGRRGLSGKVSPSALNQSPLRRHVDPATLSSADKMIRLGTSYGGWLIPAANGLNVNSNCYLAGAGEDLSFDCELAIRFKCKVRIIDPTPRAIEHFHKLGVAVQNGQAFPINNSKTESYAIDGAAYARLSFIPVGLADQDRELKFFLPRNPAHVSCSTLNLQKTEDFFTAQCHRLATIMAGQGDSEIDLLKMDIEGAEYMVIRDIVSSGLVPRILLIEFDEAHTPLDAEAGSRINEHIRLLLRTGMRCVALEGSNATFVRQGE